MHKNSNFEFPEPAALFDRLRAGEKRTVVVYGTSLTKGGAWVVAMREWFEDHYPGQVSIVNSAGAGKHSGWGLEHLEDRVLNRNPHLVLLEFSFNDACARFGISPETSRANLDRIVRALRAQNPDVVVAIQIMNPAWDAPDAPHQSASDRPRLEECNDAAREYAAENALPLLDHYRVWKELEQTDPKRFRAWIPDGCHPDKEGGLAVTWATLRTWLERGKSADRPLPREK